MPTIRDPQTDVSTADYIIKGPWAYDQKLTYTSSLGFANDRDIPDKEYVDSKIVGGVDEDNIYYVGNHGIDSGKSGRNIGQAFLTIQKGIDEANAAVPTTTNQYNIKINDGGSYDSFSLASKPYIQVNADGAQFQTTGSSFIIGDHNTVNFDKGTFVSGTGTFIEKQGTEESYLNGNEISGAAVTTAIKVSNGTLYTKINKIDVGITNTSFSVDTNAQIDFDGQYNRGKIEVGIDGYASITVHNHTGDITVGDGGILTLNINGSLDGNITVGANSIVKIFTATRTTYLDDIDESANFSIDYMSHRVDQHKNLLIGADYAINPRQEIPSGDHLGVSDDSYVADNTIFLSDGDGIVDVIKGENDNLKMITQVPNKQFGILIPVENKDSLSVIGDKASISVRAAWTDGSPNNLRMALLSWNGTEDAITTDVVSAWGLTPAVVANWVYENTPTDLNISTLNVYKTFKIEDIPVDTINTKNVAVFIWVADTVIGIGDTLEISNVRCNKGIVVEDFAPRPFTDELLLCKRFYDKSYGVDVVPGTITSIGSIISIKDNVSTHTLAFGANIRFKTSMLKTPSIITYSTFTGDEYKVYSLIGIPTDLVGAAHNIGSDGCQITTNPIPIDPVWIIYHWIADARF